MNQAINDKMNELASIRNMMELKFAVKALFCNLTFGPDEFDVDDIKTFIVNITGEAMVEAIEGYWPVELADYPSLPTAIAYVKRHVTMRRHSRSEAEQKVAELYDLPVEAMQILRTELDKEGIR